MCKVDLESGIHPDNDGTPKKIAVIGGGVSGLSAAWHLLTNTTHEVHVFESESKLGGHAYTTRVVGGNKEDEIDVDVGFMVFNDTNYPNMVRWFDALQVPTERSDMSLSVSLDGGTTMEWNSDGLNGLFARRHQLVDSKFYQMILDMQRFHNEAPLLLQLALDDPRRQVTTGHYLRMQGYSEAFGMYYLLPMMAALWSASMADVMNFPAVQLISFLANHKMLNFTDRPQVCVYISFLFFYCDSNYWTYACVCSFFLMRFFIAFLFRVPIKYTTSVRTVEDCIQSFPSVYW